MPIRIWIADDHAVFRSGLKVLLEKEPDLEVVGETGNGFDTIRAVSATDLDVLLRCGNARLGGSESRRSGPEGKTPSLNSRAHHA